MRISLLIGLALILAALVIPQGAAAQLTKQPTATGSGGAAATVDLEGTRAAIRTLRRGGNAIDAAVAAAAVLGVTEPFSCGIGGGGFMVIRTAKGKVTTIDAREESPRTMRARLLPAERRSARLQRRALQRAVGGRARHAGQLGPRTETATAPGRWPARCRPGIRVARDGFTVDQTFFDQTQPNVPWFDDIPSTAAIYLDPDGTPRDLGTTLQNPDMARTYRLLAREGVDAFYRGELASAMAEASQHPPTASSCRPHLAPGPDDHGDLRRYRAIERRPTHIGYRGLDVWGMGPPSSGGSTVGEALNIFEGYQGLSAADRVSGRST